MGNWSTASRYGFRFVLAAAALMSLAVSVWVLVANGAHKPETWAITAASMAVITSVVAAWSSLKVIELQEDAQKPNLFTSFDFNSRYSLAQIRVKNTGGTAAHNISLEWTPDLKDDEGKIVGFPASGDMPAVSVLLPGESISQFLGGHAAFLHSHPESEYTGFINFQDASRATYRRAFRLDGRQFIGTPQYDEEAPKTHYQLQAIPKQLKDIQTAIERLATQKKQ